MRSLTILGSTGSVGTQALDVVRRNPDRFKVVGLAALTNHELLVGQIREFLPPYVAIADPEAAEELREMLGSNIRGVDIMDGPDAAERLSRDVEADMVLNALVGSAGLPSTLAALQSGKTLALANKESLVIGGELVMDLIKAEPERLVPVDSEHAALAQLLRGERKEDVKSVILTGSGGPFRGWTRNDLARASVKEALAHPVWQMGPKITVDSATLANKGLELIEAHFLFGLPYERIEVVLQPTSVVHALVRFRDGASLAHLGYPDMRVPISFALTYPERSATPAPPVDFSQGLVLAFELPDLETFPLLALARHAGEEGGTYPCAFNAANEVAVAAFLEGRLPFLGIAATVEETLAGIDGAAARDLDELVEADATARRLAERGLPVA